MRNILIIDDAKDIRDSLEGVMSDEGYNVTTADSGEEGLKLIEDLLPELILLDIWMEGMDGVEVLTKIKESHPDIEVVMISGHATIETAVKTTKLGAYDFIEKPLSLDKVVLAVEHALEKHRLVEENKALKSTQKTRFEIIGETSIMKKLKNNINQAAPSNAWILITGSNGTGKELVARNIHIYSTRSDKPFVEVNCAAIPDELIESELFGHEKGAFTGAVSAKKGRFDMADRGTLFLDEIGDMSLSAQAKILRILQEQSFERVGGTKKINVDVRVVAATNKNLEEEIKKGNFREDLYYRLNVIPFHVPLLRERADDITLFVNHFVGLFAFETGKTDAKVSDEAMDKLVAYSWPGNVRELRNMMEMLVIMSKSSSIDLSDLPSQVTGASASKGVAPVGDVTSSLFVSNDIKGAKKEFEKVYIKEKLKEHDGNIAKTAEAIGLERSHLYRKIKSYGLEV